METETLFTATKWEILKLLEQKEYAPIELADALNSSLANVSQQLRLLEMAGLVTSERVSNRDKGKPRVMYKLAGDLSYMIAATDSFVDKKVVKLSERNKIVLRIWFLEDPKLRYALEKGIWKLDDSLTSVAKITYAGIEDGRPVLETTSEVSLPESLDVGGPFGSVTVRQVEEPVGYVLYAQE